MRRAIAAGAAAVAVVGGSAVVIAAEPFGGDSASRPPSPCVREDDGTFIGRWPPIPECIPPGWTVTSPRGRVYKYPGT